jgi:C-terminal processing protease CtpA/Prc
LALSVALLASCGGGSDSGNGNLPQSCSDADLKPWLRDYFDDAYFWYKISPKPQPSAYASTSDLFNALLYTGTDTNFPSDRWSYFGTTAAFNQFFGDGQSMGYGLSVAGLEVTGQPAQPLYVRYVEPKSPAAAAGVVRGDRVISLNGRSAADIITADDFSALTASASGQSLSIVLRNVAGADRTVVVTSAVYDLTPALPGQVVFTPLGGKLGYVVMKDMISQANAPLAQTFADFKAQGVSDVVIDLRYNGGGLVSMGGTLASYVAGNRGAGQAFAKLLYNDKHASSNESFNFQSPASASALGVSRAFVLMGRRTCSASELVINGLRGVGVQVIAIGETTCGKPVGFLPQSDSCGTTYSVVNFESVNARNEGRYFDGFMPTCAVAEDWTKPLGATNEPLLANALMLADGGACPVTVQREQPMSLRRATRGSEPGEQQGMIAR